MSYQSGHHVATTRPQCSHQAVTMPDLQATMHPPKCAPSCPKGCLNRDPIHPHGHPPSHPPTFSPGNSPIKHPKVSPSHPQILVFSIVTHMVAAWAPLERCLVSDHLQTRLSPQGSHPRDTPARVLGDHLESTTGGCGGDVVQISFSE